MTGHLGEVELRLLRVVAVVEADADELARHDGMGERDRVERRARPVGRRQRGPGGARRDESLLARRARVDDLDRPRAARCGTRRARCGSGLPSPSCLLVIRPGAGYPWPHGDPHAQRSSDVNLLDHDLFAEREPWDVFELLQREAPVFRHPEPGGDGFWCVTRYDDVVQVLKDTATFSSEAGGAALIEPVPDDVLEARRNFMETDPPLHSQWRRMFARDFTPRSLERYRGFLPSSRATMLDETLPQGEFDFVEEIAGPIPIRVLGHMLGVDDEHLAEARRARRPHARADRPRPDAALDAHARAVEVPAVRLRGGRRAARARAAADRRAQGAPVRRRALDPRERRDRRLPGLAARSRQQPRAARRGRQRDDPPGHGARACWR